MDLNKKIEARRRELELQKISQQKEEIEKEKNYLFSEIVNRENQEAINEPINSPAVSIKNKKFQQKLSKAASDRLTFFDWLKFLILVMLAILGAKDPWWVSFGFSIWAILYLGNKIQKYKSEIIEEAKKTDEFKRQFESNTGKSEA